MYGGYERSRPKIAFHYFRSGWLFLDVFSVFPFDLLTMTGVFEV